MLGWIDSWKATTISSALLLRRAAVQVEDLGLQLFAQHALEERAHLRVLREDQRRLAFLEHLLEHLDEPLALSATAVEDRDVLGVRLVEKGGVVADLLEAASTPRGSAPVGGCRWRRRSARASPPSPARTSPPARRQVAEDLHLDLVRQIAGDFGIESCFAAARTV
jgi:hypothetical protein